MSPINIKPYKDPFLCPVPQVEYATYSVLTWKDREGIVESLRPQRHPTRSLAVVKVG